MAKVYPLPSTLIRGNLPRSLLSGLVHWINVDRLGPIERISGTRHSGYTGGTEPVVEPDPLGSELLGWSVTGAGHTEFTGLPEYGDTEAATDGECTLVTLVYPENPTSGDNCWIAYPQAGILDLYTQVSPNEVGVDLWDDTTFTSANFSVTAHIEDAYLALAARYVHGNQELEVFRQSILQTGSATPSAETGPTGVSELNIGEFSFGGGIPTGKFFWSGLWGRGLSNLELGAVMRAAMQGRDPYRELTNPYPELYLAPASATAAKAYPIPKRYVRW